MKIINTQVKVKQPGVISRQKGMHCCLGHNEDLNALKPWPSGI